MQSATDHANRKPGKISLVYGNRDQCDRPGPEFAIRLDHLVDEIRESTRVDFGRSLVRPEARRKAVTCSGLRSVHT